MNAVMHSLMTGLLVFFIVNLCMNLFVHVMKQTVKSCCVQGIKQGLMAIKTSRLKERRDLIAMQVQGANIHHLHYWITPRIVLNKILFVWRRADPWLWLSQAARSCQVVLGSVPLADGATLMLKCCLAVWTITICKGFHTWHVPKLVFCLPFHANVSIPLHRLRLSYHGNPVLSYKPHTINHQLILQSIIKRP